MRKDLKIGLAIGGVLLAVLIVYLIVPGKKPDPEQDQVALDDQQQQQPVDDDGAAPEAAEPQDPADSDVTPPAPGTDVAAGDTPAPGVADVGTTGSTGGTTGGATAGGGNENWSALLNGENTLIPLRTSTPQPGDGGADDASPFADSGADDAAGNAGTAGATVENDRIEVAADTDGPSLDATDPFSPGRSVRRGAPSVGGSAGATTHVVQEGDTLSVIAQRVYGSAKYWTAIEKANPDVNPNRLKPNTVLKIPAKSSVVSGNGASGASASSSPRQIDSAREYRVQPGDSLRRIAKNRYGSEERWKDIYDLNKAAIGSDPAKLKLDMVLKLPAETSTGSGSR